MAQAAQYTLPSVDEMVAYYAQAVSMGIPIGQQQQGPFTLPTSPLTANVKGLPILRILSYACHVLYKIVSIPVLFLVMKAVPMLLVAVWTTLVYIYEWLCWLLLPILVPLEHLLLKPVFGTWSIIQWVSLRSTTGCPTN